jgi:uracil-DNA glycosylase
VIGSIPSDWREALGDRLRSLDLRALDGFVAEERGQKHEVYPPPGKEFEALRLTPFADVRVVILGQDPYHKPGQAHGLAFSTLARPWPPSLRNILAELRDDCGYALPERGSLEPWAKQGVLLLNTLLTVGTKAGSHKGKGWEQFSSAIMEAVAAKRGPIAFLLWGAPAIRQGCLIPEARHVIIESSHPSPLSANRPCGGARKFVGSRPFSRANEALKERGAEPIVWRLG